MRPPDARNALAGPPPCGITRWGNDGGLRLSWPKFILGAARLLFLFLFSLNRCQNKTLSVGQAKLASLVLKARDVLAWPSDYCWQLKLHASPFVDESFLHAIDPLNVRQR